MGAIALLPSPHSARLVQQSAFSSFSSSDLLEMEVTNSLWQPPPASAAGAARRVAIRRLAENVRGKLNMPNSVKHSIAVMVFKGNQVLSVRRSNLDDELPGIWGLPAGTFRTN